MGKKNSSYMKRMAELTGEGYAADAEVDLSEEARDALLSKADRMSAAIFQELSKKGYIVAEKRGWKFALKAQAFQAARGSKANR